MSPRRLLLVLAALVLALVLGTAAGDIRRWRDGLRSGDVRYAVAPPEQARWTAEGRLPDGAVRRTLGLDDDLAARRALLLYRAAARARPGLENAATAASTLAAAEQALADVAANGNRPARAQASVLLGVLAFKVALQTGLDEAASLQSIADLRRAILLDPASEEAKYDLELVLRLLQVHGVRAGVAPTTGGSSQGRRGGGGGPPGTGY